METLSYIFIMSELLALMQKWFLHTYLFSVSISEIYSTQKINTLNCPAINTSAIQK